MVKRKKMNYVQIGSQFIPKELEELFPKDWFVFCWLKEDKVYGKRYGSKYTFKLENGIWIRK